MVAKTLAVCATGAAVAVLAAGPSYAAGVKGYCTANGLAKTNPPVQLVGGKGSFSLVPITITCVVVEKGTEPVIVHLILYSDGIYKNVVCGTGKAFGESFTLKSPPIVIGNSKVDYGALVEQLKYEIEFAGGVGVLYWHDSEMSKLPGGVSPKPVPDPKGGPGKPDRALGGDVLLNPVTDKPGVPAPPACGKAFHVSGDLVIDTEGIV